MANKSGTPARYVGTESREKSHELGSGTGASSAAIATAPSTAAAIAVERWERARCGMSTAMKGTYAGRIPTKDMPSKTKIEM